MAKSKRQVLKIHTRSPVKSNLLHPYNFDILYQTRADKLKFWICRRILTLLFGFESIHNTLKEPHCGVLLKYGERGIRTLEADYST